MNLITVENRIMKESKHLWAVVSVWRGLPSDVELFRDEETARRREKLLRKRMPLEDEIGVFQVGLPQKALPKDNPQRLQTKKR
ncbi:MAG: hypothetical protein NUW37_03885 [Planctomycetes bacterium]|nr:hypothetical protein [Planctomycetota bacterium]